MDKIDGEKKQSAQLLKERSEAISALRNLCEHVGDNEWEDNLHLADIINKHLADYIVTNITTAPVSIELNTYNKTELNCRFCDLVYPICNFVCRDLKGDTI